ncbi:MAG: tetratricopeptide repeat protein [Candidatus Cloacimonetes bacterium]|nr:tetratricopeptide repeat protein [Candidatus Cloacimonadota bacterium]
MKLKLIFLLALSCVLLTGLLGQYNEKDILLQQANTQMAQRQYTQAEQLYLQVLQKFPNDLNTVLQLTNLYFSLSQTDKAEKLLLDNQRIIPAQMWQEQHIQLLVLKAEVNNAWQESMAYLDANNHDENKYRQIASYFARKGFNDKVLELYQMARVKLTNPELFRLEIANTSMLNRMFELSIKEYLSHLEKNPVNLFFVSNQLKTMLQEDSTLIIVVQEFAGKNPNITVQEAYANSLVYLAKYSEALQIYKKMDLPKLYRFAEELIASGNDNVAYQAYDYISTIEKDSLKAADLAYRRANIRFLQADFTSTETILREAINLPLWKDRSLSLRSQVGMKLRKLMADNSLALGEPADSALAWLEKAKTFGRDNLEKQSIDLEIARLLIMTGERNRAVSIIAATNQPALNENRDYLHFLTALLWGEIEIADSLMNEYIIKYPASANANDAIYLNMLTLGMEEADQKVFFNAIRLLQMNNESGLDSLELVFQHNKDEELRLLAIEWSLGFGNIVRAIKLLDYEFSDPVAQEYAQLLQFLVTKDKDEQQRIAKEFLKEKPNSIFSPNFRQKISRMASPKPNL